MVGEFDVRAIILLVLFTVFFVSREFVDVVPLRFDVDVFCNVGVTVVRAITDGELLTDVAWRDIDSESRTAASACMMPMQHINVKSKIRFIPVIIL